MEGVLPAAADRLSLDAVSGTGQPAAAAGGGGRSPGREAIRQSEERGAAAAGQCAVRGLGRRVVRPASGGESAYRLGQFVSAAVGAYSPGPVAFSRMVR